MSCVICEWNSKAGLSGTCKRCGGIFIGKHGGPRKGAGRKAEDEADGTARYNVSLDAKTVKKAKKLGEGNLSLGLRKAVKAV